jgi:hypothetical protein
LRRGSVREGFEQEEHDIRLWTYAAKICRHVELLPGTYHGQKMNCHIMALPLWEAHAVLDRVELEGLPRLGGRISLNDHMQANVFSLLLNPALNPDRDLWQFTQPLLLKRQHLEPLEGWRIGGRCPLTCASRIWNRLRCGAKRRLRSRQNV